MFTPFSSDPDRFYGYYSDEEVSRFEQEVDLYEDKYCRYMARLVVVVDSGGRHELKQSPAANHTRLNTLAFDLLPVLKYPFDEPTPQEQALRPSRLLELEDDEIEQTIQFDSMPELFAYAADWATSHYLTPGEMLMADIDKTEREIYQLVSQR